MTLLGESSPAGPQLRHGAVPGDRIIVLGPLGLGAAGLELLSMDSDGVELDDFATLLAAHRRPTPRVYEGAILGLYGVPSAMLDVSDGFLQDLGHILRASKVGASIESHSLPRHPELVKFADVTGADMLSLILTGGEDYELLFTVPPARMPKLWELARRYEWDVYDGMLRSTYPLPFQITTELHLTAFWNSANLWWAGRKMTAGEVALWARRFYDVGYRVAKRAGHARWPQSKEVTLVRFRC